MKTLLSYTLLFAILLISIELSGQEIGKNTKSDPNVPIFEIKNDLGQTVFAVYPGGVHIFIDDQLKATGGGFKVGRIGTEKTTQGDILTVDPGEVNVFIDDPLKATGGGFKVGRIGTEKAAGEPDNFLTVTPDSTRVYISETSNDGFAVGKLGVETGVENFLDLTPENYFIGHRSGKSTTGLYNLFLGYESGLTNTTGQGNTFVGYKTGNANIDGRHNIYMGYEAGLTNEAGRLNVFIGYQTGRESKIFAHDNVYVGYGTARDKPGGSGNVMLGKFTGVNSGESQENVVIGNYAGAMIELEDLPSNESRNNVIIGNYAGRNGIGVDNVIIGGYSGYNLDPVTSKGNIFIGNRAGQNESGSDRLYIANTSTSTPLIHGEFDNSTLTVNGNLYYTGEFAQTSDLRLKTNLLHLTSGLKIINSLNSYYFDWNNLAIEKYNYPEKRQIGFVAQEVEVLIPEIVTTTSKGYKAIDYTKLTPIIVEAIKEQQGEIVALKKENSKLKTQLSDMETLKSEVEALKKLIQILSKEVLNKEITTGKKECENTE